MNKNIKTETNLFIGSIRERKKVPLRLVVISFLILLPEL